MIFQIRSSITFMASAAKCSDHRERTPHDRLYSVTGLLLKMLGLIAQFSVCHSSFEGDEILFPPRLLFQVLIYNHIHEYKIVESVCMCQGDLLHAHFNKLVTVFWLISIIDSTYYYKKIVLLTNIFLAIL